MDILLKLLGEEGSAPKASGVSKEVLNILDPIFMSILAVMCIAIIVIVLMQKSKEQNMSAIGGGIDTNSFYEKNRANTKESKLKKATVALGVLIVIVSIVFFILHIFAAK